MEQLKKTNRTQKNRIPRNFSGLFIETLTDTNAGKKGDTFYIYKNDYNEYIGINERTNQSYLFFVSRLRNAELTKILRYC